MYIYIYIKRHYLSYTGFEIKKMIISNGVITMMFKPHVATSYAWQEKDDTPDADSLSVQALVISKKAIPAPRDFSTMCKTFDGIPIPGRQHVPCLFMETLCTWLRLSFPWPPKSNYLERVPI